MQIGSTQGGCSLKTVSDRHLNNILIREYNSRPKSTIQDYYKLVFQSCLGPSHIIKDTQNFIRHLENEMRGLQTSDAMPLAEDITLFEPIARVHLAAVIHHAVPQSKLVESCIDLNRSFHPVHQTVFQDTVLSLPDRLSRPPFNMAADRVRAFIDEVDITRQIPVHHSSVYRHCYSPHYRLVRPEVIDKWVSRR